MGRGAAVYVYEIADKNDTVVYVGMTTTPIRRFGAHRRQGWGYMATSIKLHPFDDLEEAAAEEHRLIEDLQPLMNVDGNDRATRLPGTSRKSQIRSVLAGKKGMTAAEIKWALKKRGEPKVDFVGIVTKRMVDSGELVVVGQRERLGGRHATARVFALPR